MSPAAGWRSTTSSRAAAHPRCSSAVSGTGQLTVLAGGDVGRTIVGLPEDQRPDAVFCANDLLAVGFMQAVLMFSDLRVPADIAIVGYDDIDYAFSTIVPLTSVRQP